MKSMPSDPVVEEMCLPEYGDLVAKDCYCCLTSEKNLLKISIIYIQSPSALHSESGRGMRGVCSVRVLILARITNNMFEIQ